LQSSERFVVAAVGVLAGLEQVVVPFLLDRDRELLRSAGSSRRVRLE
jgi:hypothetical protein